MIEAVQLESHPLNRGRPTKFTPERIQQICNLVERGKHRDEIAEIIGVTTGTLQVACSKLGVSLRRPTFDMGTGLLSRRRPRDYKSNNSSAQFGPSRESTEPRSVTGSQPDSEGKGQAEGPWHRKLDDRKPPVFAIRMEYKGQERSTGLPLDEEMIGQLAMEAEIRGMGMGEMVGALILAIVKKDLFQLVRGDDCPRVQAAEVPQPGAESPSADPSTFEG
jgi:hypothetical protein